MEVLEDVLLLGTCSMFETQSHSLAKFHSARGRDAELDIHSKTFITRRATDQLLCAVSVGISEA